MTVINRRILLVALIIILWKSINLLEHCLKTGYGVAVFLVLASAGIQVLSAYVVLNAAGIRMF